MSWDFTVQEFVAKLSVQAFILDALPQAFWLDVERLETDPSEPSAHCMGRKLGSVALQELVLGSSDRLQRVEAHAAGQGRANGL